MTELTVDVCGVCGHAVFPKRALCPCCGARDWRAEAAGPAIVEEVTTHRRGGTIVSVRTQRGPVVIARAPDGTVAGAEVALTVDGGAPVASGAPASAAPVARGAL